MFHSTVAKAIGKEAYCGGDRCWLTEHLKKNRRGTRMYGGLQTHHKIKIALWET